MRQQSADAINENLLSIFNFPYNNNRTTMLKLKEQSCKTTADTINTLNNSDAFDKTSDAAFEQNTYSAEEADGFVEVRIVRNSTVKKGIIWIETSFLETNNSASAGDIRSYSGPLVFQEGRNTASLFLQVKLDTKVEENEVFAVQIKELSSQSNRRKRMVQTIEEEEEEEKKMEEEEDEEVTGQDGSSGKLPTTMIDIHNTPPCNLPGHWPLNLNGLTECLSFSLWSESLLNKDNPLKHEVFNRIGRSEYRSKKYSLMYVQATQPGAWGKPAVKEHWQLSEVSGNIPKKLLQLRHIENKWKWIIGDDITKVLENQGQLFAFESCNTEQPCHNHEKSFCKKLLISNAGMCKPCNYESGDENVQNERCGHLRSICLSGRCIVEARNTPYKFIGIENNAGVNFWTDGRPETAFANKPITYYKLNVGNSEPINGDRCNVQNNQFGPLNTIPPVPDNELEDSKLLTRAAMKLLDRLVNNEWQDFKRQCIAIAKVISSDTEEVHLVIAGNLDGTFLGQARTRQDIEKDILHILFNEEKIEFPRSVRVLNSQEQTAGGPPGSGFSHKHAEMQILKHCQQAHMKIVSLHVTKPPCCACNRKLDYALTKVDNVIDAPFENPQIPRVFSGPGSTTCRTTPQNAQNNPCGHQFILPPSIVWWKNPWIAGSGPLLFPQPDVTLIYPRTYNTNLVQD